jgi:copper oxidase (laccase) domain-containing protein
MSTTGVPSIASIGPIKCVAVYFKTRRARITGTRCVHAMYRGARSRIAANEVDSVIQNQS